MHHRKAFGPHRRLTPQQKARNVALSILEHGYLPTTAEVWARYGLEKNAPMQILVNWAIEALEHPKGA